MKRYALALVGMVCVWGCVLVGTHPAYAGVGKVDGVVRQILEELGITSGGTYSPTASDLGDVTITSAEQNDVLQHDGTEWVNRQGLVLGPVDVATVTSVVTAQIAWERDQGAITHLQGPADADLTLAAGTGQDVAVDDTLSVSGGLTVGGSVAGVAAGQIRFTGTANPTILGSPSARLTISGGSGQDVVVEAGGGATGFLGFSSGIGQFAGTRVEVVGNGFVGAGDLWISGTGAPQPAIKATGATAGITVADGGVIGGVGSGLGAQSPIFAGIAAIDSGTGVRQLGVTDGTDYVDAVMRGIRFHGAPTANSVMIGPSSSTFRIDAGGGQDLQFRNASGSSAVNITAAGAMTLSGPTVTTLGANGVAPGDFRVQSAAGSGVRLGSSTSSVIVADGGVIGGVGASLEATSPIFAGISAIDSGTGVRQLATQDAGGNLVTHLARDLSLGLTSAQSLTADASSITASGDFNATGTLSVNGSGDIDFATGGDGDVMTRQADGTWIAEAITAGDTVVGAGGTLDLSTASNADLRSAAAGEVRFFEGDNNHHFYMRQDDGTNQAVLGNNQGSRVDFLGDSRIQWRGPAADTGLRLDVVSNTHYDFEIQTTAGTGQIDWHLNGDANNALRFEEPMTITTSDTNSNEINLQAGSANSGLGVRVSDTLTVEDAAFVVRSVESHTTSDTLTAAETWKANDNQGTAGDVLLTLPAIADGLTFTISQVSSSGTIGFEPPAGTWIVSPANGSLSAGQGLWTNAVGTTITVTASGNAWIVTSEAGTTQTE